MSGTGPVIQNRKIKMTPKWKKKVYATNSQVFCLNLLKFTSSNFLFKNPDLDPEQEFSKKLGSGTQIKYIRICNTIPYSPKRRHVNQYSLWFWTGEYIIELIGVTMPWNEIAQNNIINI